MKKEITDMSKIENKEEYKKANVFGTGVSNDGYAQYFTGASFLNPLTEAGKCAVFLANVTFKPGCRNNWHVSSCKKRWWTGLGLYSR